MKNKILFAILDDDPTGIQTVQNCLLFTRWDTQTLETGFKESNDFFFILTNTRACTQQETIKIIHDATNALLELNLKYKRKLIFIIRSDSTLRGHFPIELESVISSLPGTIDGRIFAPVFIEGNRITENDNHYIVDFNKKIPCEKTEFARDSVFPYTTAYLPGYIEEKTQGIVQVNDVLSLRLEENESQSNFINKLNKIKNGQWAVINSSDYPTLNRISEAFLETIESGKTWIFQSSASLVKSLTRTESIPLLDRKLINKPGPGIIIAGSHVNKTTEQLEKLQSAPKITTIEVNVKKILSLEPNLKQSCMEKIIEAVQEGKTPLIFTSRTELVFTSSEERQLAGKKISTFIWSLVRALPFRPAFIISKGGITSHDILTKGLGCSCALVKGQAAPGVPVVCMPEEHRWKGMPFIIFPGNVGSSNAVLEVFRAFSPEEN